MRASSRPNSWGLFDMHGNAWEWVEDCWTSDPSKIPTDGSALARPGECEIGVVRGGSWASGARRVRSASRLSAAAATHDQNIGFRIALPLDERKMSALKDHRKEDASRQR
jgi:formylglycine-generating enzyme required for sulfatase activity